MDSNKLLYHLQDSPLKENHYFKSDQKLSAIKEEVVHLNFIGSNTEYEIEKLEKARRTITILLVTTNKNGQKGYMDTQTLLKNFIMELI